MVNQPLHFGCACKSVQPTCNEFLLKTLNCFVNLESFSRTLSKWSSTVHSSVFNVYEMEQLQALLKQKQKKVIFVSTFQLWVLFKSFCFESFLLCFLCKSQQPTWSFLSKLGCAERKQKRHVILTSRILLWVWRELQKNLKPGIRQSKKGNHVNRSNQPDNVWWVLMQPTSNFGSKIYIDLLSRGEWTGPSFYGFCDGKNKISFVCLLPYFEWKWRGWGGFAGGFTLS